MEYAQLESRISFLDNEYRREKADLAQLKHRLEMTESERDELVRRVEILESTLKETRQSLDKIDMVEAMLERFKGEVNTILDDQRKKMTQTLREADRARALEMESHTKAISDIRKTAERNRNLDELISLARTETDRQGRVIVSFQERLDTLAKQTDEHLRSVSYLEEQRRNDTKRIGELKEETTDLFKQQTLYHAKLELLEQQIPQFGKFQMALEKVQESVRTDVERAQYQHAQVEREVKNWNETTETMRRRLDDYENRMERYAEHYQRNLKALESLQAFQEQLKRDQHEFMELHRLNANRLQSTQEAWQANREEAFRKESLELERRMAETTRQTDKLKLELQAIDVQLPRFGEATDLLLKILEEDILNRAMAAREWQARFESLVENQE